MQRRVLWLIACILGGGSALLALTFGVGLLVLALLLSGEGALTVAEVLPAAGVIALGLGLGISLALQGWAGWRGRPSRPFDPPRTRWLWFALVFVIALGAAVGLLTLAPVLLLPPIHVLAMVLPPLAILGLVGRALRGVGGSWREVVAGMAGGGFLGTGVSLVGEGLIVFAAIVVVTIVMMMIPGGPEQTAALARDLQDPAWQADPTDVLNALLSPAVAVSVLGIFSIPIPLIEEVFKTLAAGVAARWVRPASARAFLWGVASGAGFALAENLFNGALGGAESWAFGVVARLGATMMHCFTGGLVGWGWGQLWAARRPLHFLGSYAAAVAVHSLWNAAAVSAALLGVSVLLHERDVTWVAFAGLGLLTIVGVLGVLAVAFIVALSFAARGLAAQAERS